MVPSSDGVEISMWRYCKSCKMITPIVAVSNLVWMLSFASFLTLQFYDENFLRRGSSAEICQHSIHQGHAIYFSKNNFIVSFDFHSIVANNATYPDTSFTVPDDAKIIQVKISGYPSSKT